MSAPADPARLDPATYSELNDRDFALLVKDPDAAKGRKVVVYGRVTQFDAATGKTTFRANTAATVQDSEWGYSQNTIVHARDAATVADVVQEDVVKMFVTVDGSQTYDTAIGGQMTVPQVTVNIIERIS
ncbi:hypothetical protein [Prescottella equi]|uniref:hypothetical protein n=1 Tax=Rhodococcus hoagii TaxID=43767 RepID=UPI00301D188D